jgi:hypothetical protein
MATVLLTLPDNRRGDLKDPWGPIFEDAEALLAVGGGAFLWTTALLPSATALLVAFALVAYTIHRYEIVRIGLLKASETL